MDWGTLMKSYGGWLIRLPTSVMGSESLWPPPNQTRGDGQRLPKFKRYQRQHGALGSAINLHIGLMTVLLSCTCIHQQRNEVE